MPAYLEMKRQIILPPPPVPDPLFDDFVPGRLIWLLRRLHRKRDASTAQVEMVARQLKRIDPRFEPLVDEIVEGGAGANACVVAFMDLVGPELAVGAAIAFRLIGIAEDDARLAWTLAEQKTIAFPQKGNAAEIGLRLMAKDCWVTMMS